MHESAPQQTGYFLLSAGSATVTVISFIVHEVTKSENATFIGVIAALVAVVSGIASMIYGYRRDRRETKQLNEKLEAYYHDRVKAERSKKHNLN